MSEVRVCTCVCRVLVSAQSCRAPWSMLRAEVDGTARRWMHLVCVAGCSCRRLAACGLRREPQGWETNQRGCLGKEDKREQSKPLLHHKMLLSIATLR